MLTSLTPLSLLPLSLDFFFFFFAIVILAREADDLIRREEDSKSEMGSSSIISSSSMSSSSSATSSSSSNSSSSPELLAPITTRSSLKCRIRAKTSELVPVWIEALVPPVSILRPLLLLLPPLP